ncbi:MAG TPA: MG2 domain-containing protein [Flavobacteriales bacterium]|nr:MG2 domain-containing protein [Flavobacteriales bacterium]
MSRLPRCVRVLGHVACVALLLSGCRSRDAQLTPDAAFTPYIPAFTAGHISARAPILVRIAEDQRWRDSSNTAIQDLFDLDPNVEGTVSWKDELTLAFQPAERLEQEETYTVNFKLGRLIELPSGMGDFKFQVTTVRQGLDVRVSDMQSLSQTDLTWQRVVVSVATSDDASGQDLEGCFTATQKDRTLPLTWEHEPNGLYHRFTVDSVLRGETPSLLDLTWNGDRIGSTDKGSLPFDVPAIGDLALISATTNSEGDQYATLLFSDPLDPAQDLNGLVGITGADDLRIAVDGNKILLYPTERLSGDVQGYVSASVQNVNHRKLGKDITVDLTFEELKPAVRMVGKGTVLPSSDGLLMPFEAVNLSAVEVRVVRINTDNVAQFLQVNELDGERELARVGRLVTRKTIPLRTADAPDLGRWNRFHLDLGEHFKAEPGAIYRVELSFSKQHSVYPCSEAANADQPVVAERTWEEEQAAYDRIEDYWYYDDYYYEEEYDYSEREDPCSPSYFARRSSVSRNILASDLGLIAKGGNDGSLLVAVSDLRSTEPLSGVKLDVLDLQRQSMTQVVTDGAGLARIPSTEHKPFLLLASKGTQRGYLKLDDGSSLSVSEFDVQGDAIDRGLKGYLYGERGVWRPGDSLYLSFMLQDVQKKLPKDHPVVLELSDPRGRLDQKHVRTSSVNGVYAFRCATSSDAPTGFWNARVVVGGTSFNKSIRIETVKPNRLKILLDVGERLTKTDDGEVTLRSNWLHGAPARSLKARVTVTMTPGSPEFKGYEKYTFNDLRTWVPEEEQVAFDGTLSEIGEASFPLEVETGRSAPAVVNTNVVTRVFEPGGDASMDRTSIPYYPYASYAGVKAPEVRSAWGNLVTDTSYTIPVVAVDANGKPLGGHALKAQVYKLKRNWWWEGEMDGPSNYVSSPSVELRKEMDLVTDTKGRTTFKFRIDRPEWGRFAVRITDPASGHATALQLYMDWPGWEGRSRREDPEQAAMLSFNADKEKYNVGDEATLIIPSAGTGRALISLETGSRVIEATWLDLKKNETRYSFKVTEDMAPNVYAHVSVIQPHAKTENDLPIRLYGVIPILVEDPATHIAPVITMAKEVRTDVAFDVEVSEKSGKGMTYTLAIVDEGLLDLTRFKTPDPWGHFYAREALGVKTWDIYDDVIGAFGKQIARILALGGSDDAGPAEGAKANRFKPVVRFVGPFDLPKGRKAKHNFTIGNYVGSVRVMVVASDGEKAYGNAEKAVPVRKPLMLLATLPRVLAPGEVVDLPVTVFAMDAKVKDVQVKIEPNAFLVPEGPAQKSIRFNSTGDQVVFFKVRVKEGIGVAKVKVSAAGAGESASESIELQVRQPNLPATDATEAIVEAGKRWEATPTALGVAGTNSAYLEVSTIPPVDMGRRLQYLIDYPHGCLEQTTSKAFPQLYLSSVMELPDRSAQNMRGNVEAALRKLTQFQRPDGSFNYWPGGGDHYDQWTSIYAGHFMVEAERQGFVPPQGLRAGWLSYQRRSARDWNNALDQGWSREASRFTQAYRLYVLALAGSQELSSMNRLRDQADLDLRTRWMLAAAYGRIGRKDVAEQLVKDLDDTVPAYTEMAFTYGSDLRDEALIAEALLTMDRTASAAAVVQRIAKRLSADSWYSTQSTAFGLMAVARLAEKSPLGKGMSYTLTVSGKAQDRFSEKAIARTDLPVPNGKSAVILNNTGKNLLYVRLVRIGTPLAGEERASNSGLGMQVAYTTMDGTPVDPSRLAQGTDFMASVTLSHTGVSGGYQQLALTQVFPSGWEIRNARLEGSEVAVRATPFTYQDVRDDRVMTYFDLWKGNTATYQVMLNAAYTGRYYMPGTTCEAMYDHTVNARSTGKWVEVVNDDGATVGR